MAEVYRMFEGAIPPEAVVEAGEGSPSGRFYAALYVGLFYDVRGDRVRARQHLAAAARETYARVGGYMHRVAVVHLGRMDVSSCQCGGRSYSARPRPR